MLKYDHIMFKGFQTQIKEKNTSFTIYLLSYIETQFS